MPLSSPRMKIRHDSFSFQATNIMPLEKEENVLNDNQEKTAIILI
jgi:hypothetical protein